MSSDRGSLDRWLEMLAGRGAADLFLVAGSPPAVRVDGAITVLAGAAVHSLWKNHWRRWFSAVSSHRRWRGRERFTWTSSTVL